MKSALRIAAIAAMVLGGVGASHAQPRSVSQTQSGSTANGKSHDVSAGTNLMTTAEIDDRVAKEELRAIKRRASAIKTRSTRATERRLESIGQQVDLSATSGEQPLAERLAAEFGITPEAMSGEKTQCECRWSDLMIAHTLAANSEEGIKADQLIELHRGGLDWSQIAAGMGYPLDRVVVAMKDESRVAVGSASADGKVALTHGRDERDARARSGTKTSMPRMGPGAESGVDVKVGSSVPVPPLEFKP